MQTTHQRTLESLNLCLSQSLGVPVQVGSIEASLAPSVVLKNIRVGKTLSIAQVEVVLALGQGWRPIVHQITLVKPALRLSANRWPTRQNHTKPQHLSLKSINRTTQTKSPTLRAQAPEIIVKNGTFDFSLTSFGRKFEISAKNIHLGPGPKGKRMVIGNTTIATKGQLLVDFGALGADLDPTDAWRPRRVASLGGMIFIPERDLQSQTGDRTQSKAQIQRKNSAAGTSAVLNILAAQLHANNEGFSLELNLLDTTPNSGQIHATASIDKEGQPKKLNLHLKNISLAPFAKQLAPLGIQALETRLDGRISISAGHDGYEVKSLLDGKQLIFKHSAIAEHPIGPFDGEFSALATIDPHQGKAVIEHLDLSSKGIKMSLTGEFQSQHNNTRLALNFDFPKTSCQKILLAIPSGFAPKLQGMAFAGSIGLKGRLLLDTTNLSKAQIDFSFSPMSCKVISDPPEADPKILLQQVAMHLPKDRPTDEHLILGPNNPYWRPLKQMSRHLISAFIAGEDNEFFSHNGFDPKQLRLALIANIETGRLKRGASTITQQLVKNVFLNHRRNFSRKFQEAILAWRTEQVLSKNRILELYLNMVEMGAGIHGVEQASQTYFGVSAQNISPLQAAHLAALTPSPRPLAARFRRNKPDQAWRKKLALLLRLMYRNGFLSQADRTHWTNAQLTLVQR
ncbi:MAG: transglycosylase domain-containing protein [Pseudomonadota bacterium]